MVSLSTKFVNLTNFRVYEWSLQLELDPTHDVMMIGPRLERAFDNLAEPKALLKPQLNDQTQGMRFL